MQHSSQQEEVGSEEHTRTVENKEAADVHGHKTVAADAEPTVQGISARKEFQPTGTA